MTIRKITNLTSGLVTLADLRTPTTFVHKATVTRPTITASNITQAAIVKSTLSTRQIVAAARFVNRLIFREADAFALLDLIGLTVGKPASDNFGLVDVVSLLLARNAQRFFDDAQLIDDFIAFVLHVNRSFSDVVEVQQYINLIVAKSAGNDIVGPADSRYFDLALRKADAVVGSDTRALLVNKSSADSTTFADELKITSRKLLNDSTAIDSYFALRAGKGIFDNIGIASLTQKDFGKLRTDSVAIDQTQAIAINKAAADRLALADVKVLAAVLGKADTFAVTENRVGFFISKGLGDNQPMTDLFGVFDGLIFALSFQLFDALAVPDAFARRFDARRSNFDVLASTDQIVPQLGQTYRDNTAIVDIRGNLFGKSSNDSVTQADFNSKNIGTGRADRIDEVDIRSFLVTNLRQDFIAQDDSLSRSITKLLIDENTLADAIAKFSGLISNDNLVVVGDQRYFDVAMRRTDLATFIDRRGLFFEKTRSELITGILPTVPAAPEIPSLSSYSTVLRSTLAVNSLNKVEIGAANIYNTTNVSGGRLLFTGYPGTRYIDFAPVSSYQADGANWSYGLDVEFYGGDGSNELETPDAGEDLVLLYSTNGGASFTTAQTLWAGADNWATTVGANSSLVVNATVSSSASTGFIWRIAQFNYSNPGFDQYAVARATATNWGAAATTIQLTDLVAIYDYARATPQDRQVYIFDSVFVLNLRPRSAADDIVISDVNTFNSTLQKFDAFGTDDLLTLVFDSARTFDPFIFQVFITDASSITPGKLLDDLVITEESSVLLRGLPREDSFAVDDSFSDIVRAFRVFPEGVLAEDRPQDTYFKPAKQGQGVTKTVVGWGLTISRPPDTIGDFMVIGDPTTFATTTSVQSRRSGTSLENFSFQYFKPADNLVPARVTVGGTSGFRAFNSTSTETVRLTVGKLLPRVAATEPTLGSIAIGGFASLSNSGDHSMAADFTIEAQVYVDNFNAAEITLAAVGNPSFPNYYRFGIDSNGRPFYSKFGLAVPEFFGGNIITGRWYHLAFTRLGDVMTCWLNGYNQGSFFAFGAVGNTQGLKILETLCTARISQFRIINGLALYQNNFAPPRSELQTIDNTTVLLPTYDAASFITNYNATYPLTSSGTLTFSALAPYRINDGTTELLFVGRNDIRRTSGSNLENTAFNFIMPAKAGAAYTIFTETQDGALDSASSLSVLVSSADRDRVGIIDSVNANFYVDRGAADTLIIGSRIPFRTPSGLERISFLVTKFVGDTTTMLDLANVFDGLIYVGAKIIRDNLIIGLPNTTRVSDSDQERTSFVVNKSARQGAALKVVAGWGSSIVTTSSSNDRIVIGDPSIFATTTTLPSRRSGTSLENVSFQYFKPADGLIGAAVTPGSSLGDRLRGANQENIRFTFNKLANTEYGPDTAQPYDLNSIFKQVNIVSKAGAAYSIARKTIDGLFENQSSVAVGIGAQQPDQTGVFDFYLAEFATQRPTNDSVILGSRIPFRTPSGLERISFLVTKFFGDDRTTPDDFLQTFDGLTYAAFLLERDAQTIGSGALAANNRFLGSEENTAFDVRKSARQGAILRVVQGWGSSVTGTTSSGDFIVAGDPTALPTTNAAPSRRSGASLENISFQYFKPADGLIGTSVTVGSSLGDRLTGANRENISFIFRKLANTEYGPDTVQPYDLNSIFKQFNLTAKAGSAYSITRKTINGLPDFQSSVAVGIGAQQPDQTGVFDEYLAEWYTSRTTSDSVILGSRIPFRTPSNLERISFLITKFFGDDGVIPDDFLQTFDGLTYAAFLLERDAQTIGSGATAANNRFLGSPEVINFDVVKSARQGAILNQITGWGSSVTGTTSSGDFVVVGDPTALPTTNAAPSRRSGARLENISLQYAKLADNTVPAVVIPGSSIGDRLQGANRENVSFVVRKLAPHYDTYNDIDGYAGFLTTTPVQLGFGSSASVGYRVSGSSLENTAFNYSLSAKAGAAYSITRKTINGLPDFQSSVAVGIGAKQLDQTGIFDEYFAEWYTNRTTSDAVTIGFSIPFRTPNNIERISFLIGMFFGYDGVIPDDFLQTFDGLTYRATSLTRDTQIMGSGAAAANNRFLGSNENTAFDFTKSARQGAPLNQLLSWGTSVTGTTSSGDFVVIGDPSALARTSSVQSRRSGSSLERFSFNYSKPLATTAPYGTNLLLFSEQIGTLFGTGALQDQLIAIAAAGASFNSDYFVAPDRTITGDRIDTTSTTGSVKYDIIVSSSTTYTWSFWALKTVASGSTFLSVRDYTNSNDIIAPTDYQPNLSLSSWTRIVRTFTTPANAQSIGLNFITGSSNSIGLWGWSLEPGSSTGPYIRTTSAAIVGTGYGVGIEYNNVGVDDVFRRVIPFRRLFQDGQEAFERSFKDVSLPRAGVDSFNLAESIIVTKLLDYRFSEVLGDRDPYGTVALVDRGFVRMTNYVEDIDYFAEDYTGVQRNLSNFYYPPLKVDVEDFITVSDDVSFVTGQWVQRFFGPFDPLGDLDPFGNINTLINRGTLRITNYVEDIDYFESDYIGESRTIS